MYELKEFIKALAWGLVVATGLWALFVSFDVLSSLIK